MLRPSRPMMRPFSSSDFSSTTDTVVSTACPPATRCIQVARMLRARRSASWRVSSSTWRISRALSWRSSSSSSRSRICLACPGLSPDTRSSSRICSRLPSLRRAAPSSRLRALSASTPSRWSSSWRRVSSDASFARSRSSRRASSSRRARSSASRSSPRLPADRPLLRAGPWGRTWAGPRDRARRRRRARGTTGDAMARHSGATQPQGEQDDEPGHSRGYRGRQQDLHFAVSSPGSCRAPFSSSGDRLGAARTQGLLLRARASGRAALRSVQRFVVRCAGRSLIAYPL